MQAYLFVHFREKTTPDGEQVYFGLSRDGFHWEAVNDGRPVLWAYYGDKGVRDFTIIRSRLDGRFYLLATDLSLAYGMRNQYRNSWDEISRNGSKCLALWESDDLVNWSEQRLVQLGDERFGCLWAPDIIWDAKAQNYVLHWSSSHICNDYGEKGIYCSRTRDFRNFSEPEVLYRRAGSDIIDSAIYEEDGVYWMFVKSSNNPARIQLLHADCLNGPWQLSEAFSESMEAIEAGLYEAPTAVRLQDGKWALFLDYYGVKGAGQGYVPFLADRLSDGRFTCAKQDFSFPYGFKHGTILPVTMEEYERIRGHRWQQE